MISILENIRKQATDITGAIRDVWEGEPLDPARFAEKPVKWWNKAAERPVYEPPKKKKQVPNAREFWGSEMLAEILEMNDDEWLIKYGSYSVMRWNNKYQAVQQQRFDDRDEMLEWLQEEMMLEEIKKAATEIDFDGELAIELTPREYGELRAYKKQKLDDYTLASKVKLMKSRGQNLVEISKALKEDYQLIRHYSSALKRAEKE